MFVNAFTVLVSLLVATISLFALYLNDKITPNIFVAQINLSGKTKGQAEEILKQKVNPPKSLALFAKNQDMKLALEELSFSYNYPKTVINAYNLYRQNKFPFYSISLLTSFKEKKEIDVEIEFDKEKLDEYISIISDQLSMSPIYPSAKLENGEIVIEKGKKGETVDSKKLANQIVEALRDADFSPILIPFVINNPSLSEKDVENLKTRLNKLVGKNIELEYDDSSLFLNDKQIISATSLTDKVENDYLLDLVEDIKQKVERETQNAIFKFENGKVVEFKPAQPGLKIEEEKFIEDLKNTLSGLEKTDDKFVTISIPFIVSSPEITTDSVNDLGINELVGKGSSSFRGSIWERVYNIERASSKFNGVLIAPGEVFSFNKTLGDVSELTGYKQAYIIKDGKTVLGDGGGVCQVSTTMFRAALYAGLPILERRGHSYRVSYYEQDSKPGLDATVYDPTTDLKFKNDTPAHILIQTFYNKSARTLSFEFYGTSDGRVSKITTPIVTDVTPPPEDLYIDDPNLPAGEIKQIDYKAWGAKARFEYTVTRNGETIYEKIFYSNYQPWQAKFLRGTGSP